MQRGPRPWHGGRILVAEDYRPLADITGEFLAHCGLVAVGPATTVVNGCSIAREYALDGAILDLKLKDDLCLPICRILAAREIPFLFLSGFIDLSMIPLEFRGAPLISKPFETNEMKAALNTMLHLDIPSDDLLPPASSPWRSLN